MKKAASFALGCKVNQYESEAIAELFAEKGYEIVGIDEEADVYVINTCTVTNFGDKKSRQLIRKVKRQNENAIVAVVGLLCADRTQGADGDCRREPGHRNEGQSADCGNGGAV